jgi:2-polyprenyl-3-methyl-5-hydroxy-6-metoxy-1,4-benzoquinol methylase
LPLNTSTDKSFSISAQEFVWTDSQIPEAHSYLLPPMIKVLRDCHANKVLDLGCGNGSASAILQSQGFLVSGCDVSTSGLASARKAYPSIDFFSHDISCGALPPKCINYYDAIISLEVLEHLLQPRLLVANAYQALRPGGVFVVSTPFHGYWKNLAIAITNGFDAHWHPLRDFGHVKFFSQRTLLQLLSENGFSIEKSLRLGRIPVLARSMMIVARRPA